ncbi:MAG: PadR family transcriptional regulator [Chloroflexi bacterium]|nr:PadR family transcriptional regulator [Chloroflexota bacterium]
MPPRPLTHAEQAILSLVAEAPRHGYEIEQVIRQRGMREWADLGFSSIYYLLGRLERRGLVRSARRPSPEGPLRRVYRCTPAGASALRQAVVRALTQPEPGDSPVQLALANLPVLSARDRRRAIAEYHDRLQERETLLRKRHREQPGLPDHVQAMFARSEALLRTEIRWAKAYLAHLARGPRPHRPRRERRIP